jgi:hypothetical protein
MDQTSLEISKFKAQSSNKSQTTKFKLWHSLFDFSLMFDIWCLIFAAEGVF